MPCKTQFLHLAAPKTKTDAFKKRLHLYRTTFYIGVTSDLEGRVWQHINNQGSAFVKKYKLYDLVYFEYYEKITDAIDREKQLKNWHTDWKINLIKSVNPEMKDLKGELDLQYNFMAFTYPAAHHVGCRNQFGMTVFFKS